MNFTARASAVTALRSTMAAARSILWAVPLLLTLAAAAQDVHRVPVRVIEGKLVVACDLSTPARRLPVNLFVEYDTPCALQLHNKAAAGIRCETPDGRSIPITIHLGRFEVTVDRREHGDEDLLDDFTKYHSVALGEKAVVGTIGAQILDDYFVAFDLHNGFMELGPPRPERADARDPVDGAEVVPITEVNGLAWLPVRHADGTPGAFAIGTARYDSTVDYAICDRFDRPAGNLPSLRVGDFELTDRVALRPEEVVQVHPDGVVGVLGLGLLETLRVEVDRVNRVAIVRATAPAAYPEADFAFFEALMEDDTDLIAAFLEAYPEARLAREAAELLLRYRLDEGGDPADCEIAIRHLHRSYPEDLRTTAMLDLAKTLIEARHPEQAVFAGELGIADGRKDRYPNAVHQLHARMGRLRLDKEPTEAWKHLLSAAFGMPEDGMVNLDLGRFYESQGRLRRAFSRYVQAVIKPDSGPAALEGLQRVQKALGADRMSVDEVEAMVAGKVHGFGAANQFRPEPDDASNRVVLVEFFTNANLGDAANGGAIGGALGNNGLVSHFSREHAAFITYHLTEPELVPLTNELAVQMGNYYGVPPTRHIVDGVQAGPGAGKWRAKEQIYNAVRGQVVQLRARPSDYEIDVAAVVEDGTLRGRAVVRGPARPGVVVQLVLVERGVLFPGRSEIVVHRNVARTWLTQAVLGDPFEPEDGAMTLPFECDLAQVAADNLEHLEGLEASGAGASVKMSLELDPEQLDVVAVVRHFGRREVLQARQVSARTAREDEK